MAYLRVLCWVSCLALAAACGGDDSSTGGGDGGPGGDGGGGDGGGNGNGGDGGDTGGSAPQFSELWYSVDDILVYIPVDEDTGVPGEFVASTMDNPQPLGQNMLTMLDDGSLVGGRLSGGVTSFYHIPNPVRDGSEVEVISLGEMVDDPETEENEALMMEGLYTDCDGRLYGMDTGVNDTSSEGNRLIRFTGDFLSGDFTYIVISDLGSADVADIDDMGPTIVDNQIQDNPGLAIDTGTVYNFNYETGSGTEAGSGGTFGIHALGRELFTDDTARLYVFDNGANLYEMDVEDFSVGDSLGQGPEVEGTRGHSGLAGPLTNCVSGFTPIE